MTATYRRRLLDEADRLVNGQRNQAYNEPIDNFTHIARLWSAHLGMTVEAHDVAILNVLQKVARLQHSPGHRDSWVDIAGYAACGADVALIDEDDDEPEQVSFIDQVAALPDEDDTPAPTLRSVPERKAPAKVNADNPAKVNGKWDWDEVGRLARHAQDDGLSIAAFLRAQLDVTQATAGWMVKRCRELGHLRTEKPWTAEPIAREPFDADKARAAAVAGL